jgi:hypothetical protein
MAIAGRGTVERFKTFERAAEAHHGDFANIPPLFGFGTQHEGGKATKNGDVANGRLKRPVGDA